MSGLPSGLEQAFRVAAAELGMCSAAWLFTRQIAADGADEGVAALRDEIGRDYPVLDAVAARWLEGVRTPHVDPAGVLAACEGATRLVVVGVEADFLDALVPALPELRIALVTHADLEVDWDRVLSNFGGRVEPTDLATFQSWAGRRSVLSTFGYGVTSHAITVSAAWLRVMGEDVRTQFRSIVAWNTLRSSLYVYPRWLVEVSSGTFSHIV